MNNEIAQLKAELEQARETNRRLNRRCQELESILTQTASRHYNLLENARREGLRARNYANELRDAWFDKRYGIHASYRKEWEKLPKPEGWIDGIKARVDEALKLIAKKNESDRA